MRRYTFFKPVSFFCLTNPLPDEERDRSRDVYRSIDEEEGVIDDESDVELDGNDLLDLDLEHSDEDFESDLSDSEDIAGSAEEFQWFATLPETKLSLRIPINYIPPHQLSFSNYS